jgi:hypothetical protein
MPELVVITWYGLFVPAGVRKDVVERLNADVNKVLGSADAVSQLTKVDDDACGVQQIRARRNRPLGARGQGG